MLDATTTVSDAKRWIKRQQSLKTNRCQIENRWQEVAEYCFPAAANITKTYTPGTDKSDRVKLTDSTGIYCANLLAKTMHGLVTPPNLPWVNFYLYGIDSSKMGDSLKLWLDNSREMVESLFNLSNFDTEMQIFYKYLMVFGTAGILFEEVFNSEEERWEFLFTALHPKDLYIAENPNGIVDTIIRPFKYSAEQIEKRWPKSTLRSKKLKEALEKDPDKQFDILHVLAPVMKTEQVSNAQYKYFSKYILKDGDNDGIELDNGKKGFFTQPGFVVRWERVAGEPWGNSPAMDAIPFIKSLTDAVGLQLDSYDKALNPPIVCREGNLVSAKMSLATNAINYMQDPNEIKPLIDGARFDVAEHMIVQMREEIKRIFYVDQIQPPPMEGTPQTAFAWRVTYEFQNRVLGPMFGRFKQELLSGLVERAMDIAIRRNLIAPPPPGVPGTMNFEYIGPLAQAQKRFVVDSIDNWMAKYIQLVPTVSAIDPSIVYKVNWNEYLKRSAAADGVPQSILRKDEEVQAMVQAAQQQQQAMQVAQMLPQAAGAAKDFAMAENMNNGG